MTSHRRSQAPAFNQSGTSPTTGFVPAHECVMVGDRVPMDLTPAHELGFRTVHMRWGRGHLWKKEPWVDHSIRELSELLEIV